MNQNLIDNENLQNDRLKLQQIVKKDRCYGLIDCEMNENGMCNLYGPCPNLEKPKTNGDVIRESNENMVKFIDEYEHDSKCNFCIGECIDTYCDQGLLNYLNQPIESEVNNG